VRSRGSLPNKAFKRINVDRQHDNATDAGPLSHDRNGYMTVAAKMLAAVASDGKDNDNDNGCMGGG
jgi:hypothetical protein